MLVLALGWASLRIAGRRTQNKRLLNLSWVPIGLVVVLYVTSSLVTTQRESLQIALKDLLLAVEDNEPDAIRALIAPEAMTNFQKQELDRDQVLARIDETKIDDIRLIGASVLLDQKKGMGVTGIRVNVKGSLSDIAGTHISEWAIRWRYEDGQWRATRFECIAIGADALFNRNAD